MKMLKYLFRNRLHLIAVSLIAVFTIFFLCPILLNHEVTKKALVYTQNEPLIAITALILYIIIHRWRYGITLWKRYRNSYKLENSSLIYPDYLFIYIILAGLLIIKCYNSWKIEVSPQMKYFIIANITIIIVWLSGTYYWRQKKEKEKVDEYDKYSLSDEPIIEDTQDLLGREKFIDVFYKEIEELPFQDSFVFGLYGSWGEGKSSALNLLKNKIKKNNVFLLVDFKPWYFKDEEAILNAFYKEIEQVITQNFILPDLGKTFSKYRKIITSGIEHSGIKIGFNLKDETIDDMKQRIESYILQTGKKIVIFIDDIDRLQPDEILLIFKIVRNNSKFKNTIFVLSFDENYVINVLEDRWSTKGHINMQEVDLVHIKRDYVC